MFDGVLLNLPLALAGVDVLLSLPVLPSKLQDLDLNANGSVEDSLNLSSI